MVFAYFLIMNSDPAGAQVVQLPGPSSPSLQLNFLTYKVSDGLPTNNVYGIFQDSRKFIWFRTGNGLSRYDGVEFQNFLHSSKDTNSIAGNDIRSICEMPGDLIFIGTNEGLCVWNNRLMKFENWRIVDKRIKPGSNTLIYSLSIDNRKNLWINYNGELDVYDSLFRFKMTYTNTQQGKILKGIITSQPTFSYDNQGGMWFLNDNFGLVRIDMNTQKVTCFKNSHDSAYLNENCGGYYLDRQNSILWYSPWGMGLYRYDLKSKELKRYLFKSSQDFDINLRNVINGILPYREYLFCASNDGLIIFNPRNESYSVLNHNINNPFSIPDDGISSMMMDKDSTLWLATTYGICKSQLNKNSFGFLSDEIKEENRGTPIEISHFTLYHSEWLIIGTQTDGLYSYNLRTHERKHYFIKNAKKFGANFFGKVFTDRSDKIWVSSYYGLRIYNLDKNKMERLPSEFEGLNIGICIAFYQDSHLDYWMSYESDPRLIHCVYDENARYRLEKFYFNNGSFPLHKINRIQEDFQGNIWISTAWSLGFLKWSRADNTFKRLPKVKSTDEYKSESVFDLLPDHGSSIWLASGAGHGLIMYDYLSNEKLSYTTDDGLISNNLVSLFMHRKAIWISTDNGIAQFDKLSGKFTNFSQEDGLPETGFTRKFVYDSALNLLFASTPHYIIYFNPDSTCHKTISGKASGIYLRQFQVNGNPIFHDFSEMINLSPSENNVNLEFSCIDYFEGNKLKFEYQLDGLEKKWNQSGKRRFVTYANLYPGSYQFRVRTTPDGQNFSEPVTIASFTIALPFYFTWWFVGILALTVVLAIYLVRDYRKRGRKALVAVRERISRDLHDDIGSTLNSISIYSEIAKLKSTGEVQREGFLETIGSSSRDMIEQMNDIVWTVNPMNDKFDSILLRMRSFASELTEGKNVSLNFQVDEKCRTISLGMNERKSFYLIFKEAVNNAIKYSGATVIDLSVKIQERILVFIISDNGVGFDISQQPETIKKHRGGNGLLNMKARADEINGEFLITSILGKGTTIELRIKI